MENSVEIDQQHDLEIKFYSMRRELVVFKTKYSEVENEKNQLKVEADHQEWIRMQEICLLYKSLYQENRSKFSDRQGKVEELVNDNKVLKLRLTELINKMDSTKIV